jgi:hypothetical protein
MPMQFAPDLFHAALARGADLHIADIGAESVRGRLPAWQTLAFPKARGFIVLPVLVDGRPMGVFYADREVVSGPPGTHAVPRRARARCPVQWKCVPSGSASSGISACTTSPAWFG